MGQAGVFGRSPQRALDRAAIGCFGRIHLRENEGELHHQITTPLRCRLLVFMTKTARFLSFNHFLLFLIESSSIGGPRKGEAET